MSASEDRSAAWEEPFDDWTCQPSTTRTNPRLLGVEQELHDFGFALPPLPSPSPHSSRNGCAVRPSSSPRKFPTPSADWIPFWLGKKFCLVVLPAAILGLVWAQPTVQAGSFSLNPGDILVANHGGDSVLKIDLLTGAVRDLGTFVGPTDVALSPEGYLYVTEFGGSIYRLNLTNGIRTLVKAPVTPDPSNDALWGVLIAPGGDLIVTRGYDNAIVSVNPSTGFAQVVSSANLLSGVSGIDLLDAAHVVVCSTFNNQVVKVALAGGTQTSVTTVGGGIDKPRGIAVSGTNLFVTALDSSQIRQVPAAGGTVETFYTAASSLFGMGALTNGDIIAAMDMPPFHVLRLSPAGNLVQTFTNLLFSEVTGLDISRISLVVTGLLNTPPILEPIADQTVNEGSPVSFIASAVDTNWPLQTLSFSLGASAPAGAVISSKGVFSWVPAENQGPGVYPIQLIVTDDDSPPLSATNSFTVTVNEINLPPVIPAITNHIVFEGDPLSFQIVATDADLPPQVLTFSLLSGAPDGATISSNGVFSWIPSDAQGPSNYIIRVKVTDHGVPPLSATNSFAVAVVDMRLQCSDSVAGPFLVEPAAVFDTSAGTVTVSRSAATNCFFRLRCNSPVSITRLRLVGDQVVLNYSFVTNKVSLQSSAQISGPYVDELAAAIDETARSISVMRQPGAPRFYRLRCATPARITRLRVIGSQVLLEYQFP